MFTRSKTVLTIVLDDTSMQFDCDYNPDYLQPLIAYCEQMGSINKVKAIKFARNELSCGLKEAKNFVEELVASAKRRAEFDNDDFPF